MSQHFISSQNPTCWARITDNLACEIILWYFVQLVGE